MSANNNNNNNDKATASLHKVWAPKPTEHCVLCVPDNEKKQTMIALAKRATKTDALKLLLVVFDREALEGRSGLLPGGFPSCIYTHSDQPKCLRKIQMEIFNSPFDAYKEEMARDGWTPEMFRRDNIGNLLATTKRCLPCFSSSSSSSNGRKRKAASAKASSSLEKEKEGENKNEDDDEGDDEGDEFSSTMPLKANAVVFNFSFTDDDEYFECARSATGGASLEDFERVRVINVLNEAEKDDLETRLFERGVPLRVLHNANDESVFEEPRRRMGR